jgi:hypothetical protein
MVFAQVDSSPATPAQATAVDMGTAMTPVTAPELSTLVGLSRDELVAQLESVAISNEMLRQAAKEDGGPNGGRQPPNGVAPPSTGRDGR